MVQRIYITAVAVSLAAAVNAACNYGTTFFPREPNVTVGTFGYTGSHGPLNWYGLNMTANGLCAKGRLQSPINLDSSISIGPGDAAKFGVESYPKGSMLENLGTTVEVPANGTLTTGNKTYNLAQFHFHTPGEHLIDLQYFPMEVHFVFQAADNSMAVAAFLVDLGPADPLLTSVFTYAAGVCAAGQVTLTGPLDFTNLEHHLTSNTVYRYTGSLTTPPCSESVLWIISTEPLFIDEGTYNKVKNVVGFNSRYTQNSLGSVNLLQNSAEEITQRPLA